MIECFKTDAEGTKEIDNPEPGCWINVVTPTEDERDWLSDEVGIVPEFVTAALDDEERSRVDFDEDTNQRLIIVDCPVPVVEEDDAASEGEPSEVVHYETYPLTFLFLPEADMIVTVSVTDNEALELYSGPRLQRINTNQRTRLFLLMLNYISQRYQVYLRDINRQFTHIERRLRRSMHNKGLMQMLGFQNSLVYFSVSLQGDDAVLTRIQKGHIIRLYEEDSELLEDVAIEFRQAIEMCTIYTQILEGSMDTFSNVINNNVNLVIRRLTVIMLLMAVPTLVFAFYGMNVGVLPGDFSFWVPLLIAIVGCVVTGVAVSTARKLR